MDSKLTAPRSFEPPTRDDIERNEALFRFLDELGRATAASADANELLSITTKVTAQHLGLSNCAYADMDEDQDGFTIRGNWHAPGSPSIVGHYRLADFGTLAVKELGAGRPLIINDNLAEIAPEEAKTFQDIGIAATICMPLVKGGRLVALMAIHDRVPHRWSNYELTVIREVTERSWAHVERVRSEAAVRSSNERFRAAIRATRGVLWTNDASGRMIGEQPGWGSLTGQSFDQYQGFGWSDAVHPDDAQPTVAAWNEAVAERKTFVFEHRVRRSDGQWRLFLIRAVPILCEGGEVLEWVGVHTDVTEQRATEEALREQSQTLEERVRQRTGELEEAHEALRQAQKMEAIGHLTGGIAHDFNNLLTVIRGSADLLRKDDLSDEKRRRYVDAILSTADRAATLTSQLLAFARRQALNPEVFDVASRVEAIADMLRSLLGSRIILTVESECTDCYIQADVAQFETALVNMAVNARDAMDGEGELKITVRPEGNSVGREMIAVSISDTGEGIPAEDLERIFEPFYTTKAAGKGTGLGLSQVYGFVKQSDGEIDVQSRIGEGTRFTIRFSRSNAQRSPDQTTRERQSGVPHGSGRVLIVEDNAEVGDFASAVLDDLGFETSLASSAQEAFEQLAGDPGFDVIFSDVVMPGISGIEFAMAVQERWPNIPVVLTSGYSHVLAEDSARGFPLLQKPYSAASLSSAIRAARRP